MLTTFNIVEYLNERELNNLNVVFHQYATELHIELHLICRIVCALLPCHAYLNWTCTILDCASCHDYVLVVYHDCVLLSGVSFFGLDPATSRFWGPVCLRPFVFFMDSFFFLVRSQARWPYPRNHFYLYFASCSFFCYAYAAIPTTCLPCLPYC